MAELLTIVDYLDNYLEVPKFNDYCPNGLQVEGRHNVRRVISGVTASQALIDAAIEENADAILVHHGYFWRGESAVITGTRRRRIKALLDNDMSLLAYHLPLDAHVDVGNNASLGRRLGIQIDGVVDSGPAKNILFYGRLSKPNSTAEFCALLTERLNRDPIAVEGSERPLQRIAWCTGGAQGYIEEAAKLGVDAYLSGEISEQTTHAARENELHYFAAGHHATERYGPAALGEHIAQHFGIEHTFIDIDNPA